MEAEGNGVEVGLWAAAAAVAAAAMAGMMGVATPRAFSLSLSLSVKSISYCSSRAFFLVQLVRQHWRERERERCTVLVWRGGKKKKKSGLLPVP